MRLVAHPVYKFDRCIPIYNWLYPLQNQAPLTCPTGRAGHRTFGQIDPTRLTSRALYFHIPFCDTICSFCPFVRGPYRSAELVERYVQALLRELEIKAKYAAVTSTPIGAIFFGGGTPSILTPDQIGRIGAAIHRHFDLSALSEFAFEMEVKSVTVDRVDALRDIGVTHARFGVQTFDPSYRELFTLTATVAEVRSVAKLLLGRLPFVSFDLLYGMNGQTLKQLAHDLDEGIGLGTDNIDVYPINNVATQRRLHHAFSVRDMPPTDANTKLEMKLFVADYMRAAGFVPHNGHGYVRVSADQRNTTEVVSDAYSFRYHDHVYGYADTDLIGFGTGAVSLLDGFSVTNTEHRERYIESVLDEGDWDMVISPQDPRAQQSRGVIMRLPYHGSLAKSRVDWARVYPHTVRGLADAIRHGLVTDTGEELRLTRVGWYWYAELMYYLMPEDEQAVLERFIEQKAHQPGRQIGDTRVRNSDAMFQ